MTLAALKQISSQLNSFTVASPFVNATEQASQQRDLAAAPFHAPPYAVWLNVSWFSSLVFSLASAMVALFVKQWLYEATVGDAFRESARLRQYRLNGLLKWRVGMIVVALPIMLQLASILFLVGLLILLWELHSTVAAITSALASILFAFFIAVTILPVWKADCSYRSPTSLTIYAVLRTTRNATLRVLRGLCQGMYTAYATAVCGIPQLDRLRGFAYGPRSWDMPTWLGRDQSAINEQIGQLDRAMVTTAYATTTDAKFLSYMPIIFPDLSCEEIVRCCKDISDYQDTEFGGGLDWDMVKDPEGFPMMSLYALRHMLTRTDKCTSKWRWDCYSITRFFYVPDVVTERWAEMACKTMCQLAVEDSSYILFFYQAYKILIYAYGGQAHHSYDTLCHGSSDLFTAKCYCL